MYFFVVTVFGWICVVWGCFLNICTNKLLIMITGTKRSDLSCSMTYHHCSWAPRCWGPDLVASLELKSKFKWWAGFFLGGGIFTHKVERVKVTFVLAQFVGPSLQPPLFFIKSLWWPACNNCQETLVEIGVEEMKWNKHVLLSSSSSEYWERSTLGVEALGSLACGDMAFTTQNRSRLINLFWD